MRSRSHTWVLAALVALVASASFTAVASAAPAWKFNGTELSGKETIVGAAISSSLTIPGATTECEHFLYNMKISNSGGTGEGEITEVPLYECKTNNTCTVKSIEAEKLPWPTHLTTVAGKGDYLIVEKAYVSIVYAGSTCSLAGEKIRVSGSAGGLINNTAQTATFNKASFEATGTALKVGSTVIEWNGEFPTEPFEAHREQLVEG